MERYLICIDLDATFLNNERLISSYSIEYVKKLVSKGHYFIINTGRPHQGAVQYLKMLGIHQPMIVNNGSAIVEYDDNYEKVISYQLFELDINIVKKFNSEVKQYLNTAAITSIFDFYSYDLSKCPFFVIHPSDLITFHEGDVPSILNTTPIRTEYYVKGENVDAFQAILNKEEYQKEFDYIAWGGWDNIYSFEISSKTANKGKAMEFLAKKLGIHPENTIAFGDQLNDISMIEYAHDGVAIFNAREEVKQIANHITEKDNDNDGVVLYLEKLNLI